MIAMHETKRNSNYDKYPEIAVPGTDGTAWSGWDAIAGELNRRVSSLRKKKVSVAIECYSAVDQDEIVTEIGSRLGPVTIVMASEAQISHAKAEEMLREDLGDDRVFARMTHRTIGEFFDRTAVSVISAEASRVECGVVLVVGIGASLIGAPDIIIYADIARREIELRYQYGNEPNWLADNGDEDYLKKYKRGFFFEWRVLDRHKRSIFDCVDYVLDANRRGFPGMATAESVRDGLYIVSRRPFRLVPYFDPGPWGGQWMKTVCGLDSSATNYAWCFDCVPEENSLFLRIGGIRLELPSIDLVFFEPRALLGEAVHARFGLEFPIRFDFLDTMDGGNLSLQVHPLTEYIQERFGMHYTQDESYYLLDAGDDASVYLGIKTGVDPSQAARELSDAQELGVDFDADRFVNRWPARKHDHFLIPAGTIHCSGRNAMVLEISATPYIFTFKLWDWGRLGLDGRPRPIHLEHGLSNIQWHRNTEWTAANLVGRVEQVASGQGWREERTGLHEREFIETRRTWFDSSIALNTNGGVNVLNLVEGRAAMVESPNGSFDPFEVHYAETFIVPAAVGPYCMRPLGEGVHGIIKAYVRT